MTLETLCNTLQIDCSWIQILAADNPGLVLVAHHGFHSREQVENIVTNLESAYRKEIIGLGNNLVYANSRRHADDCSSLLGETGYHWLVAVPIRNHRLAGVLSVASRRKQKIDNDFTDMMTAVAGLAIMAYEKSSAKLSESRQQQAAEHCKKDTLPNNENIEEPLRFCSGMGKDVTELSPYGTALRDSISETDETDRNITRLNADVEAIRREIESAYELLEDYRNMRSKPDESVHKQAHREYTPAEYVTREEFNDFKESTKLLINNIINSLRNF